MALNHDLLELRARRLYDLSELLARTLRTRPDYMAFGDEDVGALSPAPLEKRGEWGEGDIR
jgi:hypothetical protein